MPRGSLSHKDAMQGGFGFKEGTLLIEKSVVTVFQYPAPKDNPKEQSDPFTCVQWTGLKLDKDLNVIEGEEPVTVQLRLGKTETCRPGLLKEKDFDDTDVIPKDLGDDVGTEGNSLYIEDGQRVEGSGWSKMEESLVKCGFKEAVAAKGVSTLYEGLIAQFATVEGDKYIAKKGKNAGKEVTSSNLVCVKIHKRPYEKDSDVKVGGKTTSSKTNGAAEKDDDTKLVANTVKVLEGVSAKFKTEFYTGKPVDRKKFLTGLAKDMMKQDVDEGLQAEIMAYLKTGEGLSAVAKEHGFKVKEDTVTFAEE